MDGLPFEVVSQIASHLYFHDEPIAKYAPISRSWQHVVERVTFRSIRVDNTELEYFASLFKGKRAYRCDYLASLTVRLITAPLRDGCCYVERLPPAEEERRLLSASVSQLFTIIQGLKDGDNGADSPLALNLWCVTEANCAWENMLENDPVLDNKSQCPFTHSMEEMITFLHERMRVDILDLGSLPVLHGVNEFSVKDHGMIGSIPALIKKVLDKLPNVSKLSIPSRDRYTHGRLSRIKFRKEFADAVTSIESAQLTDIELNVLNHEPMGYEYVPVPRLVEGNATAQDAYTRILVHWSTLPALTRLHIVGKTAISSDIFQNLNKHEGSTFFPSLREFHLEFMLETADGKWFFLPTEKTLESTPDPDDPIYSDKDGWDQYGDGPLCEQHTEGIYVRSVPDPDIFIPFLQSAAISASKMPRLQRFTLAIHMEEEMTDEDETRRHFRFCMVKPGIKHFDEFVLLREDELVHLPRLYWRITDWVPGEAELEAWKAAAGPDTVVCLLDHDAGEWSEWSLSGRP